jgi:hypothetical protein
MGKGERWLAMTKDKALTAVMRKLVVLLNQLLKNPELTLAWKTVADPLAGSPRRDRHWKNNSGSLLGDLDAVDIGDLKGELDVRLDLPGSVAGQLDVEVLQEVAVAA